MNKDLGFKAEDRVENIRRVGKYIVTYYIWNLVGASLNPKKVINTNANTLKGCLIVLIVMAYILLKPHRYIHIVLHLKAEIDSGYD